MRLSITRGGFCLLLFAVALLVAPQPSADHEGDHLYYNEPGDHNVITRNVVLGDPIPVCSTDYPLTTAEASS